MAVPQEPGGEWQGYKDVEIGMESVPGFIAHGLVQRAATDVAICKKDGPQFFSKADLLEATKATTDADGSDAAHSDV